MLDPFLEVVGHISEPWGLTPSTLLKMNCIQNIFATVSSACCDLPPDQEKNLYSVPSALYVQS